MTGLRVASLVVGPFQENCWLLQDEATGDAVLVDPGDDAGRIVAMLARAGGTLRAIWLTHAHLDHIGGLAGVRRAQPGVPTYMHPADGPVFAFASRSARAYGIPFEQPAPPERTLAEGDTLRVGAHAFEVWHLPGHSPGHVAFAGDGVVFSGDVLFAGSIGRSDLPLCDPAALERSLQRMLTLDPAVVVHPGHGPTTTIGDEAASNPFLTGAALIPRR